MPLPILYVYTIVNSCSLYMLLVYTVYCQQCHPCIAYMCTLSIVDNSLSILHVYTIYCWQCPRYIVCVHYLLLTMPTLYCMCTLSIFDNALSILRVHYPLLTMPSLYCMCTLAIVDNALCWQCPLSIVLTSCFAPVVEHHPVHLLFCYIGLHPGCKNNRTPGWVIE